MGRHRRSRDEVGKPLKTFVCTRCQEGDCIDCVDVLRMVYTDETICKCSLPGHDGEPSRQQILDPDTGAIHSTNLYVGADGEAIFPQSITCPKCKMTSHNPNDIQHKYCGNCNEFIEMMRL